MDGDIFSVLLPVLRRGCRHWDTLLWEKRGGLAWGSEAHGAQPATPEGRDGHLAGEARERSAPCWHRFYRHSQLSCKGPQSGTGSFWGLRCPLEEPAPPKEGNSSQLQEDKSLPALLWWDPSEGGKVASLQQEKKRRQKGRSQNRTWHK